MPWSRKSKRKAQRVVRRVKRDGTVVEYRYDAYKPRKVDKDTVSALVDDYKSSVEWNELAPATRLSREGYLKRLAAMGNMPLANVRRRDIIRIFDAIRAEVGNGAANGFLSATKAVFVWAVQKDRIEHPPTLQIKAAPRGHWNAWTAEEADKAEAGLSEHLRRVIVLARHTGQRRADLCAMRWDQYDGNAIHLTQQKTKPGLDPVRLSIPVTPTLKAELDAWRLNASCLTILENAHRRPWEAKSLSVVLPYNLRKLGMHDRNVHGLRKLAATELANAGCSPHMIASITGHRTLGMVQLYTKSADQVKLAEAAVVQLEAYRKK